MKVRVPALKAQNIILFVNSNSMLPTNPPKKY